MAWSAIVAVICLAVAGCHAANTACSSGPCQGGGTCVASGTSSYTCSCPSGTTGANCQFSVCNSWASATSIGFNPNLRGGLDGTERWTFIQKEGFATAGTLLGFKFYSYRVLPLTVGIYRPTGGTCAFTLIALYTPSVQETGVITYSVPVDQRIQVQANDTVGFTWTKLGLVTYNDVTPYQYCEDNQSPPAVGSTITLVDRRYGNRAYSFQAFITPSDSNATPGPSLGFSPQYRGAWDGTLLWTMVQTSGFPLAGTLTGFEFYAQVPLRPVQLGLYRPVAGCTFTLLKSWTAPTVTAAGFYSLKFTGSDVASFQAGDTIGLTWTGFGTVPYDVSSDFNYCDDSVGQPAVGSQVSLVGGRYGNRFHSVRPIVQYTVNDACASSPCLNGGFCCNGQSSYYCQCPPGTVQPSCAKATSCSQSPCVNGGTCVTVSRTSYTCTCLPGYSGASCETSPCDKSVTQSIGYNPVWRAGLNGEQVWTMVQIQGFPTAGVLTGYNFYTILPRPIQIGVYRPKGNCKFQLLQRWTHQINNVGQQSIILDKNEQYNFQAGDTIGFTWTNFGVVTYNDVNGYNYCEDNVAQPAVGATLSLYGGRGYGSRVYSFEAIYMQNGPAIGPAFLGFPIVPRAAEGSLLWTHVQIRGFETAGALIGFKFQVTSVRLLQLGLYRPVKGTCAFQLLKGWTPKISNIGENVVYFTGADQANFQVGDTIGFTWSNYGVVPFDVSSDYNYCEDNVAQPAVGSQVTLEAGRYGNRFWSLQAIYKPTVSVSACLAPNGCSPNPCLNGATCDADETGYSCTCPEGYSGNECEIAPAAKPCGSGFNGSQWIGYSAYDRINIDGTLLHTFVQARGFPSAGILTGFQFYATYVRPLSIGLYRWKDGCTFTLLKSWAPKITSAGIQTFQLSSSDQIRFLAGDTIGFTWSQLGVIPFAALPANDYLYCEDLVNPPAVGSDFTLQIGRYGNRFYSIQAFYSPTSIAPEPLALGWDTVLRGGLDGSLVWTFVSLNGFQTDGVLVGFKYYVYIVRPITFGIYRPIGGTCSYILLKTYTPPIVNIGVNKYILSPSEQFQYQAGDTLGFTWTKLGAIVYEDTIGPQYCEDNQAVTTEGSTITLVAKRYSNRVYSAQALYRPISSTGYYVDYCASSPCQNGGSCCSTTSAYQCTCPADTLAPNCAPTDPCKNSPCANGGVCTKISTTAFSCGCKIGFGGDTCDVVIPDPCGSSPCKNGGSCTRLDNTNFACTCTSKYLGSTCQTAVQPCAASPCKNGATCSASGTSYTCACPIGFSGANCDTVVPDPCATSPCKNGGKCTRVSNTEFSCQCGSNYDGTTCDTPLPCATSPCKNGGTCTNVGTGVDADYECNCPDDYNDGDTCTIYQDPCNVTTGPPPCRNGGKCNRVSSTYFTCTCPEGWVGTNCELDPVKPPCDSKPCEHDGVCKNIDGLTYTCDCPRMWEGLRCTNVHCLIDPEYDCKNYAPRNGRYAYCNGCNQFIACRTKRRRLRNCTVNLSFSRFIRKCTNDTVSACAGL